MGGWKKTAKKQMKRALCQTKNNSNEQEKKKGSLTCRSCYHLLSHTDHYLFQLSCLLSPQELPRGIEEGSAHQVPHNPTPNATEDCEINRIHASAVDEKNAYHDIHTPDPIPLPLQTPQRIAKLIGSMPLQ